MIAIAWVTKVTKKGLQSEMKELRNFVGKARAESLLHKTLWSRVQQVLFGA